MSFESIIMSEECRAILPLERAHIVDRDGRPVAHLAPPDASVTVARFAAENNHLLTAKPMLSVAQAATTLDRVWANPRKIRPTGTCLRRQVADRIPASGESLLGVHLTETAGNIFQTAQKPADASVADAWLRGALAAKVGEFQPIGYKLTVNLIIDAGDGPPGFSNCEFVKVVLTDTLKRVSATVMLLMDISEIVPTLYDVSVVDDDQELAARYPDLYNATAWLLDGVHRVCRSGKWKTVNANYVQYAEKMSTMTSMSELGDKPSIAHLVNDELSSQFPTAEAFGAKVPVVHQDALSGLSSGVISAGDVSPSLLTYFGVSDEASTSYSVLRVRTMGKRAVHVCKYAKATGKPAFAQGLRARTPCVRDGLLSVPLTNAMTGDGTGRVGVRMEHTSTKEELFECVPTLWTDARDALLSGDPDGVVMYTRDVAQACSTLAACAAMQNWPTRMEVLQGATCMIAEAAEGDLVIEFQYAPTKGPRWLECVAAQHAVDMNPNLDDYSVEYPSELAMDYWVSGLARYCLADWIKSGKLVAAGYVLIQPGHGLFPKLADEPKASFTPPVNVTVAAERVAVTSGGAKGHYVYSIGLAVSQRGELLGSGQAVDTTLTEEYVNTITKVPPARRLAMQKLAHSELDREDIPDALLWLRKLQHEYPNMRMYSSGANEVETTMTADHYTNVTPDKPMVRELGALLSDTRSVAQKLGWGPVDGPAQLAVLQSISSGLVQVARNPSQYQAQTGSLSFIKRRLAEALEKT